MMKFLLPLALLLSSAPALAQSAEVSRLDQILAQLKLSGAASDTGVVKGGSFTRPADASGTASAVASTTLTFTSITTPGFQVGCVLSGSGVTAGTTITALGTGTATSSGTGSFTYTMSASQTIAATTVTCVLPYAVGDLVANSRDATAVVPIAATGVSSAPGGGGWITGASLSKSGTSITNASFRLHVYKGLTTADVNGHFVTTTIGDNGVFSGGVNIVGAIERCTIDITMTAGSDGAKGLAAPGRNICGFDTNTGVNTLYILIEALGAYSGVTGETFTAVLETTQGK